MEFNDEGEVLGVTSEGETAKCKKVVCDPSYLPNKVPYSIEKKKIIALYPGTVKFIFFSFIHPFIYLLEIPSNLVKNVGESYIIIDKIVLS